MGASGKEAYFCEHCGAEADLTIEGLESVEDVIKREKKVVCKACGRETVPRREKNAYSCERCGAEADMTIEGFEGVEEVIKRKNKMACKDCGQDLPSTGREDVKAVQAAMEAEREAYQFYAKAAKMTKDPKGRDMFQQLSEFEMNHFKKLQDLARSLKEKGEWILYEGTSLKRRTIPGKVEKGKGREQLTDLDALKMAIREEKKAQSYYRSMAELTKDPRGKNMYKRLAEEEALHEKVLNDEFYSLQNTGVWSWGD